MVLDVAYIVVESILTAEHVVDVQPTSTTWPLFIFQMTLPRGPGSTRHGRGLVSGSGKLGNFWKYALTGTGHYSSGSIMRGGTCRPCRGSGKRRRSRRKRTVRLGRFLKGHGVKRIRETTRTRPDGTTITRSTGFQRSLGSHLYK
jgi:hypothetical protein